MDGERLRSPPPHPSPPSPRDWGHRGLLGPAAGSHILSKEAGRFRYKSWVCSRGVGRSAIFHFLLCVGGWGGGCFCSHHKHIYLCLVTLSDRHQRIRIMKVFSYCFDNNDNNKPVVLFLRTPSLNSGIHCETSWGFFFSRECVSR